MPALSTVPQPLAKALAVFLSGLLIAALSTWALLNYGPSTGQASASASSSNLGKSGYWLTASDGGVFTYGDAVFQGSTGGMHLNSPIVSMAATPDGHGYWLVASDGGVFTYGDAVFQGSTGGMHLNSPIVSMAATPDGHGYWLVASDGGVFTYGDAVFQGSTGGMHLNSPIVGMAATPDGHGYWLVASDGGVFTYGDAVFQGSTGGMHLNSPIVGMAATPDGHGYWLVASDGGVFTYGDAVFQGSTGGMHLNSPIVGMAATPDGHGYWLVASDGGVFTYGDAVFQGSTGGMHLNSPIVGMANVPLSTASPAIVPPTTSATAATTWACTSNVPGYDPANGGWEYWENSGCPIYPTTWIDTTHFAGQNNPASNSGSTVALGQDVWSPICANSHGGIVTYSTYTASEGTSGGNTITIPSGSSDSEQVGLSVLDNTHSTYVPTGTTVTAVNTSTGVLTLSKNLVGTATGDTVVVGDGVNDPTCVDRETQTLQANSAQNFVFTNTTPTNPSGAVTAFPDEGTYAYTGVVDDYTSLTSTYSQSMPINSNTAAWAMQDDWLTEPGRPSGEDDYEVMVQYDFSNNGSCPGGTWPTTRYAEVATNVSLGGQLWHICDGQNAHNSDGSCPTTGNFCGQLVVKLGGTATNQPDSPSTSGTLNLKAIFQWLEDNDPPGSSYPYIEPGSSIAALSQGWEIASTGGVPEQFVGNGFTVDAAGGAAS